MVKNKWIKEGELPIDNNTSIFLLTDILLFPVIEEVEKRTGIPEGAISLLDRERKVNKIYTLQDDKRGDWGYNFFLNDKKFNTFLKEVDYVYKRSKVFIDKMEKLDIERISIPQLKEIFTKDIKNLWISKTLVYFTIDSFSWKIEQSLNENLSKTVGDQHEPALNTLILQEERDALENERYYWIKNIIIPIIKRKLSFDQVKTNSSVLRKIKAHLKEYKSYSAGFGMTEWDFDHYFKLLSEDLNKDNDLKEEFNTLQDKAKINNIKKLEIIKKFKIPAELVKQAYVLGKLANLRLDIRVRSWSYYVHTFIKLLKIYSKKINLSEMEVNSLNYSELVDLLNGKIKVDNKLKERLNQRIKLSVLQMSSPQKGFETLFGKEAINRFNEEVEEEPITSIKTIKGQVACKKGVVQGRVFKFNYGSLDFNERISKFPKGAILVSNLTMPVLMPAIRKAAAMVTDGGGITCHAAIVSRELGIPCVIGTNIATKLLKDGDLIEVDTNTGVVKKL